MLSKTMKKISMFGLAILTLIGATAVSNFETHVSAQGSNNQDYVYLSNLWNDTNKLIFKESSWKDNRALKVNQNEPGKLLSLMVDGEKTYFINGIFAHAKSTLIFDIGEYIDQGFDTFSAYLGVDTYAASNGNGVNFTISVSKDNENWEVLTTTGTLKGVSNAIPVSLKINGYRYLKLFANDLGGNTSDHATYANAMIYKSSSYTPNMNEKVDFIKDLMQVTEELSKNL